MSLRLRRLRALVALLFGTLMLSGCQFDVYSLPLPGGTDVGDDPIVVEVEFADALDLVPRSSVKLDDVPVGQVTGVQLGGEDDRTAIVEITIRNDVELPENATASIRMTSLLGEKFVSLSRPEGEQPSAKTLSTGDVIPLERTGRNPEVEEVLGALSLILNGGGVAQLKTIANEVNLALDGREDTAKSVLTQVQSLVSQLDDRKGDITNALEALNRLSKGVRTQQRSIDQALEELPGAADSLNRQRGDLVRMLAALNRLSGVGVRVIRQVKDGTLEALRQLFPVLNQLGNSGDNLVKGLSAAVYPFVDAAVGRNPQVARNLHMGDYINLSVDVDVDLANPQVPTICVNDPESLGKACENLLGGVFDCINDRSKCADLPASIVRGLCKTLNLPQCSGTNTRAQNGATPRDLGGLDLGDLDLGDLGLNRAPVGATGPAGRDDPLRSLGRKHDRVLVALLGAPVLQGGGAS